MGAVVGTLALALAFGDFSSVVCLILCAFVAATILLEFYRGAKVIRARSGASIAACAIDLTMRNTRRYGGYIIHIGMEFVFIGFAGDVFHRDVETAIGVRVTVQVA